MEKTFRILLWGIKGFVTLNIVDGFGGQLVEGVDVDVDVDVEMERENTYDRSDEEPEACFYPLALRLVNERCLLTAC